MATNIFKCGDYVIANTGNYSYTSSKAVCKVERVMQREMRVKIVAILDGHQHGTSVNMSSWDVEIRHFVLYLPSQHGVEVIKGKLPDVPEVRGIYCERLGGVKGTVVVTDKKLKSFGKTFVIKEDYDTGFVNIGDKRPIIIRKEKLEIVDKPAVVGDYVSRNSLCSVTSVADNNFYLVEAIENNIACLKHVYGDTPTEESIFVELKDVLRTNIANTVLVAIVGKDLLNEFVLHITTQTMPRKFWMIATHIESGLYPAESPDGLYAPRRKIYSRETAERILADMVERHGKRFYLLETVATGILGEEITSL